MNLDRIGKVENLGLKDWFVGNFIYYLLIDGYLGETDPYRLNIDMSKIHASGLKYSIS